MTQLTNAEGTRIEIKKGDLTALMKELMAPLLQSQFEDKEWLVGQLGGVIEDTFKKSDLYHRWDLGSKAQPDMSSKEDAHGFKGFDEWLVANAKAHRQMKPEFDDRLISLAQYEKQVGHLSGEVGSEGMFLVPPKYRTELYMTSLEEAIIRPNRAFVLPMGGRSTEIPVLSDRDHTIGLYGGVKANWSGEKSIGDPTRPKFDTVTFHINNLTASSYIPRTLIDDSPISLEKLLIQLFGNALSYFEDEAFIRGPGGGQPLGIYNSPATLTITKESLQTADTIVPANLVQMWMHLMPGSDRSAIWLINRDCFRQLYLMTLGMGTAGRWIMMSATDTMQGLPWTTIMGRPVYWTEKASTLGDKGDVALIDPRYYVIADRMALTVDSSTHASFETGEIVWRFIQRVDGQPWMSTPLTPRRGANQLSPFIILGERA